MPWYVRPKIAELMPTTSPLHIDQRPTAVAGVDRHVGLQKFLKTLGAVNSRPSLWR